MSSSFKNDHHPPDEGIVKKYFDDSSWKSSNIALFPVYYLQNCLFFMLAGIMNQKEPVSLEELAISNMWEIEALINVLERKGLVNKDEILNEVKEFDCETPEQLIVKMTTAMYHVNTPYKTDFQSYYNKYKK